MSFIYRWKQAKDEEKKMFNFIDKYNNTKRIEYFIVEDLSIRGIKIESIEI
jgi:hypothetical protein